MDLARNFRNLDRHIRTGFGQALPELLRHIGKPVLLVRTRPIHLTLEAGIDQLEIEYRNALLGSLRMAEKRQQHEGNKDRSECGRGHVVLQRTCLTFSRQVRDTRKPWKWRLCLHGYRVLNGAEEEG